MTRSISLPRILMALAMSLSLATAVAADASKDEQRAAVRKLADDTLAQLYQTQPGSKEAIAGAAGYAVFSNFGLKIFLAGGGKGQGLAVNNQDRSETFMKMVELQAGLGIGVKKFRLVWVFASVESLNQFVNSGWELGAQATAAAQAGDTGAAYQGAVAVAPGVWLYQITDDGLALELTAKGTKYYKDDELN